MNLERVLADTPDVRPLEDERARFYLENRALIETWSALRAEAAEALTERILDLAVPLAADLERLGEPDVRVAVSESRGRPSVDITRGHWHLAEDKSPVQVSLETEPSAIGSRGSLQIFSCVRAKQGHPDAPAWQDDVSALGPALRTSMGRGWKTTLPRYVVWKYLDVPEDSWDVEPITLRAREEVLKLWTVAAPLLDSVLERAR